MFGWLNWKYLVGLGLILIFAYLVYINRECKAKGNASKQAFSCGFFKTNPTFLKASDEYYKVKEGKCYRYTDYGDKMGIQEVDMNFCQ